MLIGIRVSLLIVDFENINIARKKKEVIKSLFFFKLKKIFKVVIYIVIQTVVTLFVILGTVDLNLD